MVVKYTKNFLDKLENLFAASSYHLRYEKGNFNADSDIDIAVILKDYKNLIDIQVDLMRLRRNIDSRIVPHPFRERDFEITNPIVNEIVKYGQDIKINMA